MKIFKDLKKTKKIAEKLKTMELVPIYLIKGIVSRDFRCLQMILMDRIVVPDVPLEVYYFLNFRFHIVF